MCWRFHKIRKWRFLLFLVFFSMYFLRWFQGIQPGYVWQEYAPGYGRIKPNFGKNQINASIGDIPNPHSSIHSFWTDLFTLVRRPLHLSRLANITRGTGGQNACPIFEHFPRTFALEHLGTHPVAEQEVGTAIRHGGHSPFPAPTKGKKGNWMFCPICSNLQAPRCGHRSSGRIRRQTRLAASNSFPLSQSTNSGSSPASHMKYLEKVWKKKIIYLAELLNANEFGCKNKMVMMNLARHNFWKFPKRIRLILSQEWINSVPNFGCHKFHKERSKCRNVQTYFCSN
jgi:hypothetical protein